MNLNVYHSKIIHSTFSFFVPDTSLLQSCGEESPVRNLMGNVPGRFNCYKQSMSNSQNAQNHKYHLSYDVFVIGAEFFALAWGAVGAAPDRIELFHDLFDEAWIVGDDAGFEVSSMLAFSAHSGAGQVGAAGVGETAVNDDGFEMDPRTQNSLHAVYQIRIPVKIFSKGRARLFGVE